MPQSPVLIRTLIVEDQQIISDDIDEQMRAHPNFVILGRPKSIKETLPLIAATSPDLLLLDIQLKDGNAFDMLEQLDPLPFRVIFLTAFEQYAVRAIKFGALDYLLKPLDPVELQVALQKVMAHPPADSGQLQIARQQLAHQPPSRMAIKDGPLLYLVPLDKLMYVNGGEETVFTLDGGQQIKSRKRLKEYEDLLGAACFIRPHQSYLVNVAFVNRYHRDGYLLLTNGEEIPVSERRKEAVLAFLTAY